MLKRRERSKKKVREEEREEEKEAPLSTLKDDDGEVEEGCQ